MMRNDLEVAALKRELAGYLAEGNIERADQVRAELAVAEPPAREHVEAAQEIEAAAPRPPRRR